MARRYRFVGGVRIGSDTKLWVRVGAGAFYEASFSGGVYFASDDGASDDLIHAFNTALAGSPDLTGDQLVFDKTVGKWSWANFLGSEIRLQCIDPVTSQQNTGGRIIFNYLRINTGDIATFASGQTHGPEDDRVHQGGFYPGQYLTKDNPKFVARARQSVTDRGLVQTISFGFYRQQVMGVRIEEGYPRRAGNGQWRSFREFMNRHWTGLRWRFYPDRDNLVASAQPFSEAANPLGYHTLVTDKDSSTWEPDYPYLPNMGPMAHTIVAYTYVPGI